MRQQGTSLPVFVLCFTTTLLALIEPTRDDSTLPVAQSSVKPSAARVPFLACSCTDVAGAVQVSFWRRAPTTPAVTW